MSAYVSTEGLSRAAVLAALYNACQPYGMGVQDADADPMHVMTLEEAQAVFEGYTLTNPVAGVINYVRGRAIRTDLTDADGFDPTGYDQCNGDGAAEAAIAALRERNSIDPLDKLRAYALREKRITENLGSPALVALAEQIYAETTANGNANPFVPWDDPQIPFMCDCDEIIYSDTPHAH